MEYPQALQVMSPLNPNIERVENNSDRLAKRALIHFKNGYELSIILGFGTYGSAQGLFEIAVFKPDGDYYLKDNVLGYQTVEEVKDWVNKVGLL